MAFLNHKVGFRIGGQIMSVRLSEECYRKLTEILQLYPDKYENMAHVMRTAIIKLHKQEVTEDGKRTESFRFEFD